MRGRNWVAAGAVLACAVAAAGAWATSGGVTIGQTLNSGFSCLARDLLAQVSTSGNPYKVPAGTWQLTSWSVSANSSTGGMAAVIFKRTASDTFQVEAVSPTETPTPNRLNTFPWSGTVHGGELLGLWVEGTGGACIHETGDSGDVLYDSTGGSKPAPGASMTGARTSGRTINVAATLEPPAPPAPNAVPNIHHVYTCYSKFEQDAGEVDEAATAAMLVAAGRWYPTALAGNIDGGTNVGGYHLVCNPPATVQATGWYVGIGGDVTSVAEEGSYAIAE